MARKYHGYVLYRTSFGDFDIAQQVAIAISEDKQKLVSLAEEKRAARSDEEINAESVDFEVSDRLPMIV